MNTTRTNKYLRFYPKEKDTGNASIQQPQTKKKNSGALVRQRTISTERLPPVGEVSANLSG
jgi:hypothetical protein